MSQPRGGNRNVREGQWQVGARRTEMGMQKSVLEESWKMPGDARWQNLNVESWSEPGKLGRQMSEGDGQRLLRELYSATQGESALSSQNKGKSQSLPRVLSPEVLRFGEMPAYPHSNSSHLEFSKPPERGTPGITPVMPLTKPKYGRPIKPPSYELHRQNRGAVEACGYQDHHQKDQPAAHLTKVSESWQDLPPQDSGLEPPVYIPPPSYKSPPQPNSHPRFSNEVPPHSLGGRVPQQHSGERTNPSRQQPSSGSFGAGDGFSADPHPLRGNPSHLQHVNPPDSSVQYIPFDDPRIRHIQLAYPQRLPEDTRPFGNSGRTVPAAFLEPPLQETQPDGGPPSPRPGGERGLRNSAPSHRRPAPATPPRGSESHALLDQRDSCGLREQRPWRGPSQESLRGQIPSQGDGTCETVAKLKKFELGTGTQIKKSAKKKPNETIFCLVSIPVPSEPLLPDTDRNNNDLKQSVDLENGFDKSRVLQEQGLLSLSSTDLELQALTGSMASTIRFQKQEPGRTAEYKQTNDLSDSRATKHRELRYSGSWPGDQYRDQQTQTSFPEEPPNAQPPPDAKPGGTSNGLPSSTPLAPATSEKQGQRGLPPGDRKWRPQGSNPKGQGYLTPSSNSAFSSTSPPSVSGPAPKTYQVQPNGSCRDARDRTASPGPKREVVKGEEHPTRSSKELFGQFLLKPVSRRPWDAISQLESFNKELQSQEESTGGSSSGSSSRRNSSSSNGESTERDRKEPKDGAHTGWGTILPDGPKQEARAGQPPRMVGAGGPVFKPGRVKSKSESWSVELKPDYADTHPLTQSPLQAKASWSESGRPEGGSGVTKQRTQEIEKNSDRQLGSPGQEKRVISTRLCPAFATPPLYRSPSLLGRKAQETRCADVLKFVRPNKVATPPRSDTAEERGSVVRLFVGNKNQGISEPDLRTVGLSSGLSHTASQLDDFLENLSAIEIPQHESLQVRAARILGIEVAVESLIPGDRRTGPSQPHSHGGSASDVERPVVSVSCHSARADAVRSPRDAHDSRRKCGWTESPLFVGERDTCSGRVTNDSGHRGPSRDTSPRPRVPEAEPPSPVLDQKELEANQLCRSSLLHVVERTTGLPGAEKRFRSASKVIETLQGKLASPPSRMVMDRLVRMKEVDSVSRMRRLSSKSTDSGEEAEEGKPPKGQGERRGSQGPPSGPDLAPKPGPVGAVSTRVLALGKNGPLTTGGVEEKVGRDTFGLDTYDPSRVERV
ncbi:junctional protein associated with coronary artery disease isoform X2 [Tachyglossus aculeatus]|nr:junctional protein associated with coronary artery disease isoform X2 [Tachyglossus aculeatus]XP_038611925.1 junctional protein associated with coronary artery disease isoform X2 [Tachyglossus aculeatus]XP_038611926.1 junctional protein associated with coronary artery disease isoform X2 [Tachyglossus aculeatus]